MSGFAARFATVFFYLAVFQSSQGSPNLQRNQNSRYYLQFQNVPPPSQTENKLITNFLHLSLPGRQFRYSSRRRRTRTRTRAGWRVRVQQSRITEDIVVVMDGSGSIGRCEFNKGKIALSNMMELASASPGINTKYAAVTFANSVTVNFKFLPYHEAANKIESIPYPRGLTNTQAGLREAKRLFKDPSSGRRVKARKMVFLVTDGKSNKKRHLTIPRAQALKRSGVKIFVVAVGGHVRGIDEMVNVASYPPQKFLFRVKKLDGFLQIIKLMVQRYSPRKYAIIKDQYTRPC